MAEYSKVNVKLSDTQLKKLKTAVKNKTGTTLRISGGILGSLLSKLAGPLMEVAIPLAKNVVAPLEIPAAASAIDAGIQKKKKKYMVLEQQQQMKK